MLWQLDDPLLLPDQLLQDQGCTRRHAHSPNLSLGLPNLELNQLDNLKKKLNQLCFSEGSILAPYLYISHPLVFQQRYQNSHKHLQETYLE